MIPLDVLLFGGGAAGLWSLDRLRAAGFRAALLESTALGAGQTIQAQGIIHGGGKYALRGVKDFAAVTAISRMPERWAAHLEGREQPDLRSVRRLASSCHLWFPGTSAWDRFASWFSGSVVASSGLLTTAPVRVPAGEWPEALRGSAARVYAMAEPVIQTGSLLAALAAPHTGWIGRYEAGADAAGVSAGPDGVVRLQSPALELRPRLVVLAAGEGNEALAARFGARPGLMQRRPLSMVLLRGKIPPLYGHCVRGGRVHLTVTSCEGPDGGTIWQVGGGVAEEAASEPDVSRILPRATAELRRALPGMKLDGLRMAVYRAVRAEAAQGSGLQRPSGTHVQRLENGVIVAWPTKLALVPVLADEVLDGVRVALKEPGRYDAAAPPFPGPAPPAPAVAPYPWERAEWFPVPSAAPGSA